MERKYFVSYWNNEYSRPSNTILSINIFPYLSQGDIAMKLNIKLMNGFLINFWEL